MLAELRLVIDVHCYYLIYNIFFNLWSLLPYVPILSPVSEFQSVAVLSFAAENNRSPSALYFTVVMERSCPFRSIGSCLTA